MDQFRRELAARAHDGMEEKAALSNPWPALDAQARDAAPNRDLARFAFALAENLLGVNRIDEALALYRLARDCGLDNDLTTFRRWCCAMKAGRFEEAWLETDQIELARRKQTQRALEQEGLPLHLRCVWNGDRFDQKKILVRCHHGLGDTIQFIRYTELLKKIASKVIVECDSRLIAVLQSVRGIDDFVPLDGGDLATDYDVEVEVMELAYAFRSTLDRLPARVPYLSVSQDAIEEKRAELSNVGSDTARFNVGLCWAGGDWDCARNIPAEELKLLGEIPGVNWFSVQKQAGVERMSFSLVPAEHARGSLVELGAALCCMDLVISVDTMVAHLTGALGRPVWTLLPFCADWRWMVDTNESPWYPTMILLRQPRPGDWKSVIERVACQLRNGAIASMALDR